MSDRWGDVDRMSARTRARVERIRAVLPHIKITDATALTAQPVFTQSSLVVTEGYAGHRRVWAVCGDGTLMETPESVANTVLWHAERAARGGRTA